MTNLRPKIWHLIPSSLKEIRDSECFKQTVKKWKLSLTYCQKKVQASFQTSYSWKYSILLKHQRLVYFDFVLIEIYLLSEHRQRIFEFLNSILLLTSVPLPPPALAAISIWSNTNNNRTWSCNSLNIIFQFNAIKTLSIMKNNSIDTRYLMHTVLLYGSSKPNTLI